jgi:hypothetical protein
VGFGIAGIGLQARERPLLDTLRGEAEGHANRPVEGWGDGFRGWTPSPESRPGSTGFQLDSGVQGIHPGVHQPRFFYCVVISASGGGFQPGWTPKKIALTLAICRAARPSIVFGQK